jgi:hypothetical protein
VVIKRRGPSKDESLAHPVCLSILEPPGTVNPIRYGRKRLVFLENRYGGLSSPVPDEGTGVDEGVGVVVGVGVGVVVGQC